MKIEKLICLCVSVLVLCAVPASAATYYWIGDVDSNYTTWENWNTSNDGTGTALTEPPHTDPVNGDEMRLQYAQDTRPTPVIAAGDTVTVRNIIIGRNGNHGQLDVYGKLLTTQTIGSLTIRAPEVQGSTAAVNIFSGGMIETNSFDLGFRGDATMLIEEGAKVLAHDRFRLSNISLGQTTVLDLFGEIEVKDAQGTRGDDQFNMRPNDMIYMGENGLITLDGDRKAKVDGFISDGQIVSVNPDWEVQSNYNAVTGKTTVWAGEDFFKRSPSNQSLVDLNFFDRLEWTLPDPNDTVTPSVVSVDVYLGTDPNDGSNMGLELIVDNESVESYIFAENELDQDTVYYWFIDVYDTSINGGATPYYRSTLWSFDTSGIPPVVDASQDVETWLVDGLRVVLLDGFVDALSSYTSTWTVLNEPDPTGNPAQISAPGILDPTVTLTAVGTYTLQLEADDGNSLVSDTMQIIVYADACEHAKNQPGFVLLVGDLNADCKVNLVDLGMAASNWLEDNSTK